MPPPVRHACLLINIDTDRYIYIAISLSIDRWMDGGVNRSGYECSKLWSQFRAGTEPPPMRNACLVRNIDTDRYTHIYKYTLIER